MKKKSIVPAPRALHAGMHITEKLLPKMKKKSSI